MDYNKLYNTTLNNYLSIAEKLLKRNIIKLKNIGYTFDYTYDQLSGQVSYYKHRSLNNISEASKSEYLTLFNDREIMFEDDAINKILNHKIIPLLKKNNQLKGFNLEDFIKSIAIYDAVRKTANLFNNYHPIYKLMYDLNNFKKFEIKNYGGSAYNTPLYKQLGEKVYPTPKVSEAKISNSSDQTDDYLNVEDVAKLTNYAKATIYDLKHKGLIPFYKNGAKLQFKKSEIIKWMEKGKGTTKEDIEDKANEYLLKHRL